MQYTKLILYSITLFVVNLLAINHNNEFTMSKQPIQSQDKTEFFLQQPKYSKDSIKDFLTNTYNDRQYANMLALNFRHINTFLSFSSLNSYPRTYIKTVLKLFSQKLKSSVFINSYAFSQLLFEFPTYFSKICTEEDDIYKKNKIKDTLYNFFLNNFAELKRDPETSLNKLSDKIYEISLEPNPQDEDITIAELSTAVVQFLEVSLSKLIWCPEDGDDVWKIFKSIANQLELLYKYNVIPNTESLDDLYWSLIYRFCYFLEIAGIELKHQNYALMTHDINNKKISIWYLDERDSCICTKAEYLKQAIFDADIRAHAYQSGMISDMIPSLV